MPTKRWVRPLLAFLITFGVLVMAASLVRVVAVYQHLFGLGMKLDDPTVADQAARELSRMDRMYTPVFLVVAVVVSGVSAVVFALWRPKTKKDLPPPLPGGPANSGAESR